MCSTVSMLILQKHGIRGTQLPGLRKDSSESQPVTFEASEKPQKK